MANFTQRFLVNSVGFPSKVPSQPSMGKMQRLLPMVLPDFNGIATLKGLSEGDNNVSSKGKSMPLDSKCFLRSAAVLSCATRVYFGLYLVDMEVSLTVNCYLLFGF